MFRETRAFISRAQYLIYVKCSITFLYNICMEDIKAPIFHASFIVRRDICDLHGIFKIPIQTFRTKRHRKVSFPIRISFSIFEI